MKITATYVAHMDMSQRQPTEREEIVRACQILTHGFDGAVYSYLKDFLKEDCDPPESKAQTNVFLESVYRAWFERYRELKRPSSCDCTRYGRELD